MNKLHCHIKKSKPVAEKNKEFSLKLFLSEIINSATPQKVKERVNCLSNQELRIIFHDINGLDVTKFPKLKAAVIYCAIKTILSRWTGFYNEYSDFEVCYQKLVDYLKENLLHVDNVFEKNKSKYDVDKKKQTNVNKNTIEILCPYRKLKTIVYIDSIKAINATIIPKYPISNTSSCPNLIKYIINLPYIELKIECSSLVISRQSFHKSEYCFVDLTKEYIPQLKIINKRLRCSKVKKNGSDSFTSTFIKDFLNEFRNAVKQDTSYPSTKATDLIDIITEFILDVSKCTHQIDTDTDYYSYLNTYPYVRYMGVKESLTKPPIGFQGQITLNENSPNLRLQEVIYPCVKMNLSKFNYYYSKTLQKNDFDFPPEFISSMMSNYVKIRCMLCHFERSGQMAKYVMEKHIYEEHGEEPNWFCYKCRKEYSMRELCSQRWIHKCIRGT